MLLSASDIEQFTGVSSETDLKTRARALFSIARHFARPAAPLSQAQAHVYDQVIRWLARDQGVPIRATLARRLAHLERGPALTLRMLALDPSHKVAGPVLRYAHPLSEDDLIAVARVQGDDHLCAIAERRYITQAVTDLLVGRGGWPVLRAVAANLTARLSPASFRRLFKASKADGQITAALLRRTDVPTEMCDDILRRFRRMAQGQKLACRGEDSGISLDQLAPEARQSPESRKVLACPGARELALAEARVNERMRDGPLTDRDVLTYLERDDWAEALVAIARLAGEPPELVARGIPDYPLVIMRLAGLNWSVAEKVLRRAAASERRAAGKRNAYLNLSRTAAERAMRFIRFRLKVDVIEGGAPSVPSCGSRPEEQ
jgi:uncharacterized protein (DUF2336 family)